MEWVSGCIIMKTGEAWGGFFVVSVGRGEGRGGLGLTMILKKAAAGYCCFCGHCCCCLCGWCVCVGLGCLCLWKRVKKEVKS